MHGKKYVVISQEEYKNLKNKHSHSRLENPEKSDLHRSETEMKNVLNKDIPSDEKIRLFTDEFNNFKKRYDGLMKPKPLKVIMEKKNEEEKEEEFSSKEKEYSLENAII